MRVQAFYNDQRKLEVTLDLNQFEDYCRDVLGVIKKSRPFRIASYDIKRIPNTLDKLRKQENQFEESKYYTKYII